MNGTPRSFFGPELIFIAIFSILFFKNGICIFLGSKHPLSGTTGLKDIRHIHALVQIILLHFRVQVYINLEKVVFHSDYFLWLVLTLKLTSYDEPSHNVESLRKLTLCANALYVNKVHLLKGNSVLIFLVY